MGRRGGLGFMVETKANAGEGVVFECTAGVFICSDVQH